MAITKPFYGLSSETAGWIEPQGLRPAKGLDPSFVEEVEAGSRIGGLGFSFGQNPRHLKPRSLVHNDHKVLLLVRSRMMPMANVTGQGMKLRGKRFQRSYLSGLDLALFLTHRTPKGPRKFKNPRTSVSSLQGLYHVSYASMSSSSMEKVQLLLEGLILFAVLGLQGTTPYLTATEHMS